MDFVVEGPTVRLVAPLAFAHVFESAFIGDEVELPVWVPSASAGDVQPVAAPIVGALHLYNLEGRPKVTPEHELVDAPISHGLNHIRVRKIVAHLLTGWVLRVPAYLIVAPLELMGKHTLHPHDRFTPVVRHLTPNEGLALIRIRAQAVESIDGLEVTPGAPKRLPTGLLRRAGLGTTAGVPGAPLRGVREELWRRQRWCRAHPTLRSKALRTALHLAAGGDTELHRATSHGGARTAD
mmetsp:Transcript_97620/g.209469  ORF Transcript_97620/g.209469 Transcript_97620/m.209469 type:complete len:238 (+) Transcript_97620:451-1164(+)